MDMNRLALRRPASIISASGALILGLSSIVVMARCGGGSGPDGSSPSPPAVGPTPPPAAAVVDDDDERPVILFVGTSLTAGYGLDPGDAFPAVFQKRVDDAGLDYRAVNAGVSGETSAGALRRMDWLLRQEVAILVLETGANDGLRGQDPEATRANIQAIFDRAARQQPPPSLALVAMEALPNYGEDYRRRFRTIYPELAEANGAVFVPFLLEGVAGDPELNQADGIHPTAEGSKRVAENIWKSLEPLLTERKARTTEP
jgi:acyl-CoA thioesterase-1